MRAIEVCRTAALGGPVEVCSQCDDTRIAYHCVVPGGGLSPDYENWIGCKPGFFLPVRVLPRLFRRLFLEALDAAFRKGELALPGELEPLRAEAAFQTHLAALGQREWVVYAKPPFGGPQQALEYLGRYTPRVALSNERIQRVHQAEVTFQWKDYRHKDKQKSRSMTLDADEFIRRWSGAMRGTSRNAGPSRAGCLAPVQERRPAPPEGAACLPLANTHRAAPGSPNNLNAPLPEDFS